MTNDNPLITLRNTALIWIGSMVACFVGSWWIYHFFADEGQILIDNITKVQNQINLIKNDGVITTKNWEALNTEARKNERWSTMVQLVPILQKLVGTGTPAAAKNLQTMKNISQNTGEKSYISWLNESWTAEAQSSLAKTQSDIAEIIPVFAGISEMAGTKDIHGKITLDSLIEYIQTIIVDQFSLNNVVGEIGIDGVKFLPETPDIGVYEVPLKFEQIPHKNILKLLDFLKQTGEVTITEANKNITIEHKKPLVISKKKETISSLKNLLITVTDLSIVPARTEEDRATQKIMAINTDGEDNWNMTIILQFYIRGASRDHIASIDKTISTWLDKNNKPKSLITFGNTLLKSCGNCTSAPEIRDLLALLNQARAAYDSIISLERTSKSSLTPLEILEHRTQLMTTLETLKAKLINMNRVSNLNIQFELN